MRKTSNWPSYSSVGGWSVHTKRNNGRRGSALHRRIGIAKCTEHRRFHCPDSVPSRIPNANGLAAILGLPPVSLCRAANTASSGRAGQNGPVSSISDRTAFMWFHKCMKIVRSFRSGPFCPLSIALVGTLRERCRKIYEVT